MHNYLTRNLLFLEFLERENDLLTEHSASAKLSDRPDEYFRYRKFIYENMKITAPVILYEGHLF